MVRKSSNMVRKYLFPYIDLLMESTRSICINLKGLAKILVEGLKGLFLSFEFEHIWQLLCFEVFGNIDIILSILK